MSPLRKIGWVGLLAVFALAGCSTARVVSRDSSGGIVAIPENSNCWPYYYRDKAIELIKQDCPNGYAIAKQEEVVTGMVTTDSNPNSTTHTSETHNNTEYRFYYVRAKPVQTAVIPALHPQDPLPPQRIMGASLQPVSAVSSTLPLQPIPVSQ